jgi:glutamate-1-semialdehyde 2,1-aminomutase
VTTSSAPSGSSNRYLQPGSESARLYERASRVMPGGNSRLTIYTAPYPFYARDGRGCVVVDEDGEERIDFINNLTSLILGHADPRVAQAVVEQVQRGSSFAWPTEKEVRLAEILTERVPTVEQVRFANSGSEAVMVAVKAARAYTGRRKIAKFEGCYHGAYDYVEVSLDTPPEGGGDRKVPQPVLYSPGASPGILDDVVVMPFNDIDAVEAILEREGGSAAAVIVDPMPNRAGLIPPRPGFLPALRDLTRRHGMLLIADEVISFRVAYQGAQQYFGFEADLTTFGKVIGGGYPVGAVGGSAEVMSVFDPRHGKPKMPHYGTFNANPVTMAAGIATLEQLTPESFDHLNELGDAVRTRLNELFRRTDFEAQVTGRGSIFRVLMTDQPVVDYRSTMVGPERNALYTDLYMGLLARGIAMTNTGLGCTSMPMTMAEVDRLVEAVEDWVAEKQGA